MEVLFSTSLAYLVAIVTAYGVYKAAQRRRRNAAPVPHFKPTPWDTFRARVVQGTGCQTVHEALRQGLVQQLPGGWLEYEDLSHHADESATVADLAQARFDAAMRPAPSSPSEHEPSVAVQWDISTYPPGVATQWVDFRASVADAYTRFAEGDWVLWRGAYGGAQARRIGHGEGEIRPHSVAANDPQTTLLRKGGYRVDDDNPAELRSPWVGRRERHGKIVWATDKELIRQDGSRVAVADAELHWDDVRVGDNMFADAYLDSLYRDVVAVGEGCVSVHRPGGQQLTICPTAGDRFAPVTA